MAFGKTEVFMLAAIVASASYLYLCEEEQGLPRPLEPLPEDEIATDTTDSSPGNPSLRYTCRTNGQAANVFVLDLSYSEFPDSDIGQQILDDLFAHCNCDSLIKGDCYTWTLVIDELDYVRTQEGSCGGKPLSVSPVYKNATDPGRNSTVATVYVRQGASFDLGDLDCVYYTVESVLVNILSTTNDKYIDVVTVLANEIQKVSREV